MTTSSKTTAVKTAAPAPQPEAPEAVRTSAKPAGFGDHVIYLGAHGPMLAIVTAGGTGEAEVLVLTDGEVPRVRAVGLYDTPQDAAEATSVHNTINRRAHAAYWPA